MTAKEKAEMMNLRRRVEAQREEIKALRGTIAEMKAREKRVSTVYGIKTTETRGGAADGQTGV